MRSLNSGFPSFASSCTYCTISSRAIANTYKHMTIYGAKLHPLTGWTADSVFSGSLCSTKAKCHETKGNVLGLPYVGGDSKIDHTY